MPPDSLRAVLDSVFAGPAYRWVERPDPLSEVRRWFAVVTHWLQNLQEANPGAFRLLFAGMIVVLVAILVHAGWVLVRTIRPRPAESGPLPLRPARRDAAWYRDEAERLAGAGRFAEAMQSDFIALILALDTAQVVRFHPARTPREYTRDPGLGPAQRADLADLVGILYRHVFAREPCGQAEYREWRERVMPERYAPAR